LYTPNHRTNSGAVNAYRSQAAKDVETASPYHLTQMLMTGALDRIAAAKGLMARGVIAEKCTQISAAISIIDCLRVSLDHSIGGEISGNLEDIYRYMMLRLAEANARNEPAYLEEVAGLMREIKSAWDQLPPEAIASHTAEAASR